MPQISVNSQNIISFGFAATWDITNRTVLFDTSTLSSYAGSSGSGIHNVLGIAFSLVDSSGLELMGVDWAHPQIMPATDPAYTLDLSSLPYIFLFQDYKIIGYIKDADGKVYSTIPVIKTVCQPVNLTESGYVDGTFQIIPDCVNNTLTVKELTLFTYNNQQPALVTKTGTLSYPTGTIGTVPFTGTPFQNNVVYTGQYRVNCSSVGKYNLGDNIYVLVTYFTNNVFDVTCTNRIADLLCCIVGVQNTAKKECNNAKGQQAKQQLADISTYLMAGLLAEINGQDASTEADYIKKTLNCDCGATSIRQNEMTPVNPSVYSIVINGVGGTTVPSPTVNAGTKIFQIASNLYQIVKGDLTDMAFSISVDTSVQYVVKYIITFDYNVMAGYILTAFENDTTYIARLQALLITALDLSGVDGDCVIDTTTSNYTLALTGISAADLVDYITINGVQHLAPANLHCTNPTAIVAWLNTLALGTFTATYSVGVLTVSTLNNTNTLSSIVFLIGGITGTKRAILFQSTSPTLTQFLNAIFTWMCSLTDHQVQLANTITLCQIDYSGTVTNQTFTAGSRQDVFNVGLAASICNIIGRITTLTGVTCAKIQALFVDRPNSIFGESDRIYGSLGGNCAGLTDEQISKVVLLAVSKYQSVKDIFCAIDCSVPGTCPEISDFGLAMDGTNIGIYGVTWATTPTAVQTVTVKYKLTSALVWTTATNALLILPNGNISGTTPYDILNPIAGATYDVLLVNNCGGDGFQKPITTPSGTIYSGNYHLENSLYLLCGSALHTLYSSQPFASGVTMYTNAGLTTPITGYSFITIAGQNEFTLNPSTGVVGVDLETACSNGTAGSYILGNATGTICSGTPVTLYTNGAFVVGGTLYRDSALTLPQTGYAYVVQGSTNTIYNLNSVTGAIGASTGLTCNFAAGQIVVSGTVSSGNITNVTFNGNQIIAAYPATPGTTQSVNSIANTTANLLVYATGTFGSITVIDSLNNTYCQNSVGAGTYTFAGFIINPSGTNDFRITMNSSSC